MLIKTIKANVFILLLGMTSSSFAHESTANQKQSDKLNIIKQLFDPDAIIDGPDLLDCTLSSGEKSQCFKITLKSTPSDHEMGPWCPENINDSAELSGIWLNKGDVHDADGAFIKNLSHFYKDMRWQLYNTETGAVNITNSKTSCAAAARPDVDEMYQNYCVQCKVEYMNSSPQMTYVIPLNPKALKVKEKISPQNGAGIALTA